MDENIKIKELSIAFLFFMYYNNKNTLKKEEDVYAYKDPRRLTCR